MSTDERGTLADFIDEHGITAVVDYGAPAGTERPDGMRDMNPWTVRLVMSGRAVMTVPFFTGLALNEPEASDVLQCLAMDAASIINARDFWDWVNEYGMDATRETERTYREAVKQTDELRTFLGPDAFERLVWHTDAD